RQDEGRRATLGLDAEEKLAGRADRHVLAATHGAALLVTHAEELMVLGQGEVRARRIVEQKRPVALHGHFLAAVTETLLEPGDALERRAHSASPPRSDRGMCRRAP